MLERTSNLREQSHDIKLEKEKRRWKGFIEEQKAKSTWAEKFMSPETTANVRAGKDNPDRYESFAIRKMEFTDDDTVWLCFPGIGGAKYGDDKPAETISGFPRSAPGAADLTPREGTGFVFHGPTAIAGYTPEQCIRATEQVMASAELILEKFPNKKIKIFCFSAGTHLGVYVANQLGKKYGKPVDKLVVVAPGESIAMGIYKTPVTEPLAENLYERGVTMEEYDEKILPYTQRMNLTYLPAGRNLVVHAGTKDTYVSMDAKGGTNDIVEKMRAAGKDPMYVVHRGADHITLPAMIILQQIAGKDPYYLRQPKSVWENERAFEDPSIMRALDDELGTYSDDDLRVVGHVLAERGQGHGKSEWNWEANLSPYERAIARGLVARRICWLRPQSVRGDTRLVFEVAGENITRGNIFTRDTIYRKGIDDVKKITGALQTLEQDPMFATERERDPLASTVNILEEIRRLDLPADQYVVRINGAMDVTKSDKLHLAVTPTLYEQLKKSGWKERTYENDTRTLLENGQYVASTEELATLEPFIQEIDGVPIYDESKLRTVHDFEGASRQEAA